MHELKSPDENMRQKIRTENLKTDLFNKLFLFFFIWNKIFFSWGLWILKFYFKVDTIYNWFPSTTEDKKLISFADPF